MSIYSEILPNFVLSPINYSRPVRVGYTIDDPFATECFGSFDMNCPTPGYEIEYTHTLIRMMNLGSVWIYYDSYEDLLTAMKNNEIDMSGLSNLVDDEFASLWHWSPNYYPDGIGLLVKESVQATDDSFLLFESFSADLWVAMFLFTIVSVIIRIASKRLRSYTEKSFIIKQFIFTFTHAFRSKIFYGFWFLILGVLLNFYGNIFAVSLLTSSLVKGVPFTDLQDLGHKLLSKECRFALESVYLNDADLHGSLINPTHNQSWAELYRQAYKVNRPIYTEDREEIANYVLNSTCVVGVDYFSLKMWYMSKFCGIRGIGFPSEKTLWHGYSFYVMRDDIRQAIQSLVLHSSMQSFPEYLNLKYYMQPSPPNCKETTTDIVTLSISKLQDAFYIWGLGLTVAFLFLIFKHFHNRSLKIKPSNDNVVQRSNGKSKSNKSTVTVISYGIR